MVASGSRSELVDLVVLEGDVSALADLEPELDVVGVDLATGVLVDLLVADAGARLLRQLVEVDVVVTNRGERLHTDADESEADGACPGGASHANGYPRCAMFSPQLRCRAADAADGEFASERQGGARGWMREQHRGVRSRVRATRCRLIVLRRQLRNRTGRARCARRCQRGRQEHDPAHPLR